MDIGFGTHLVEILLSRRLDVRIALRDDDDALVDAIHRLFYCRNRTRTAHYHRMFDVDEQHHVLHRKQWQLICLSFIGHGGYW